MPSALMITLHFTDTQHSCDFRLHASDHSPTELQQHSRMQHQLHNRLTIQSSCNRQQFPRAPTTRSMTPLTSLQTRNPAAYVSGGRRRGAAAVVYDLLWHRMWRSKLTHTTHEHMTDRTQGAAPLPLCCVRWCRLCRGCNTLQSILVLHARPKCTQAHTAA